MTRGSLTILQLTHQGGPAGSTQSIFDLGQHLARRGHRVLVGCRADVLLARLARDAGLPVVPLSFLPRGVLARSEEHTSELQSQSNLVCRLLLEKKKNTRLPLSSAARVRRRILRLLRTHSFDTQVREIDRNRSACSMPKPDGTAGPLRRTTTRHA